MRGERGGDRAGDRFGDLFGERAGERFGGDGDGDGEDDKASADGRSWRRGEPGMMLLSPISIVMLCESLACTNPLPWWPNGSNPSWNDDTGEIDDRNAGGPE